ncbi:MAG: hypothetical protein GWN54_00185, partial [Gammaproteobacteria bacterium]|nr:hypothetical protein [Gammaproteobacteria bacterium]
MLAQWTNWIPTWDHSLEPEPWHRRAVELGRHTLGLSEQNLPGWLAIASANFYLHQWEAWEQAASEIEQRFPQHIRNPEELMGMGYLERARASAARLAEGDPEDNFWELLIALYHTHIGQFETAVSHFERAILKGYSGGAEYDMAYAYLALGDSAVMTAVQSRWYEAWDPELLPLLPHIIQLMKAPPAEFGRAAGRFRIVAHELGFEEDDLLRPGPRWGIRAPHVVAMAYGRY